ncbi:MAG TPA: DUF3850 domain-containing protein [Verrucomicrobiae bacterium]|nr:DUF3850 domain-containing protein [Verrucomicrobiae bacterium]
MTVVRKKAYPALFEEVASGKKTFDLRLADFDCRPGDVLILDEVSEGDKKPTGRSVRKKVGYVLKTKDLDFFTPDAIQEHGYQVMSLLPETTSLDSLQKRALDIRKQYDELNTKDGHGAWGGKERVMGFVADVGELVEIVMAKEKLRRGDNLDERLAHELSDCLWSVLVVADYYGVDLKEAFLETMDALEQRIARA